MNACRVVHVDESVDRFKDKYDTRIRERGVKLPGGPVAANTVIDSVLISALRIFMPKHMIITAEKQPIKYRDLKMDRPYAAEAKGL